MNAVPMAGPPSAGAVYNLAHELGVRLSVGPDGNIRAQPASKLTEDLEASILRWKPELIAIINGVQQSDVIPLRPNRVDPETGEVLPRRALTDYGNAERLVDAHGIDLRFCHPFNKWLAYDGNRWAIDNTAEVLRRAKTTVRGIYKEAANATTDSEAKELGKHAIKSEGDARIRAMVGLAQSEPGVPALPDALDADPWKLNLLNGTIDLKTGEIQAHSRADLITKLAPVAFDPEATCPTFTRFLERILPSTGLRAFVQRAAGYSLTGDTREDVLFINFGGGNNGKSTLMETLLAMMGDYGMQTPTDTLLIKRDEGIPNDVARLKGARFVGAAEAEEGRRLAESRIKQMTGGDRITARFLHGEWFEFAPAYKLWLSTNHKPIIRGTDNGIWRRIRLVPFLVTIPEGERDEALADKLLAELPGILNWALAGCLQWQKDGLGMPDEVREATSAYRTEMDTLGNWLDECCTVGDGIAASAKSLYISYQQWSESSGERVLPQRTFGMRLGERGFHNQRKPSGYWWHGLGLRLPLADEPMNERMNEDEPISGISAREEKTYSEMANLGSSSFIRSSDRTSVGEETGREEFEV